MLNADQARRAMKSYNPETLPGFGKVETAISSAISKNKDSVYMTGHIDSRLATHLHSLGYKVELTSDRNESITIISW